MTIMYIYLSTFQHAAVPGGGDCNGDTSCLALCSSHLWYPPVVMIKVIVLCPMAMASVEIMAINVPSLPPPSPPQPPTNPPKTPKFCPSLPAVLIPKQFKLCFIWPAPNRQSISTRVARSSIATSRNTTSARSCTLDNVCRHRQPGSRQRTCRAGVGERQC